MKKNKEYKPHKENLLHKIFITLLSAAATAIIAGVVGYKLNSHLPELYYQVSPLPSFKISAEISNLGRGPATELVIRYHFNQNIAAYDYDYSEELAGKLSSANIKGGVGTNELILMPHRLLPEEKLTAEFKFNRPVRSAEIKIFSKEGMGKPYSEWQAGITKSAELRHNLVILGKNTVFKLEKKYEERFKN